MIPRIIHQIYEDPAGPFYVIESTGPFMTTRIYDRFEKKNEITLLPADLVAPLSLEEIQQLLAGTETVEMEEKVAKAYAIHYFMGSWYAQTR